MITGWRGAWREGAFPFGIVQLPNLGKPQAGEEDSNWADPREAQLLVTKAIPNTGLAVAIDLGEAGKLHSPRKAEIGRRLARWALVDVYRQPGDPTGPLLASSELAGAGIRLHFSQRASGLAARDCAPLAGFAIAGPDRRFVAARATIEGPNEHATILVRVPSSPSSRCCPLCLDRKPDLQCDQRRRRPRITISHGYLAAHVSIAARLTITEGL